MNSSQTMEQEAFSDRPVIKVIGVGGGGGNAINMMVRNEVQNVEFIAINTDAQVLRNSFADRKLQIGKELTKGLGAGADPEVGRQAAEESEEDIRELLQGANIVFITCGMGGGTGTGAAPVVAKIAREEGILVVAFATKPFSFEGKKRMTAALEGIEELKKYVDSLIVVPNDRVFELCTEATSVIDAFHEVDQVLRKGVEGITQIVAQTGLINIDFADIRRIMQNQGLVMMGIGAASGPNRAIEAARAAISSPLVETEINGATNAIIYITADVDCKMNEITAVVNEIQSSSTSELDVIFGQGFSYELQGQMVVTVIATGYAKNKDVAGVDVSPVTPSIFSGAAASAEQKPVNNDLKPDKTPEQNTVKEERTSGSKLPDWIVNRFK